MLELKRVVNFRSTKIIYGSSKGIFIGGHVTLQENLGRPGKTSLKKSIHVKKTGDEKIAIRYPKTRFMSEKKVSKLYAKHAKIQ